MPSVLNTYAVKDFESSVGASENMVFIDCSRLNSEATYNFRKKLAAADAKLRVVNNRLLKVALCDTDAASVSEFCKGPTAVVTGADPVVISQQASDLAKANDTVVVKGGFCLGELMTDKDIAKLAKIPPREILLSQLLSVMNGPITGLATVLAGPIRGLGNVLNAIKDKNEEA